MCHGRNDRSYMNSCTYNKNNNNNRHMNMLFCYYDQIRRKRLHHEPRCVYNNNRILCTYIKSNITYILYIHMYVASVACYIYIGWTATARHKL